MDGNNKNNPDQTGINNNSGNGTVGDNVQGQQQSQNANQQIENGQQQNNQNTGGNGAATFTQEQVSRMMTAEKNQGRAAAYREMGIDPNDPNSVNMMNMFKAFMASMQTPEQQAQTKESQQQIKIAEVESRANKAEAKAEAMQLGVLPQYVDDAVVIIMSRLDDKTDVKTIVGELKTKYPVWFNVSSDTSNNTGQNQQQNNMGQNGTGSPVGNTSGGGQGNNVSMGTKLAARRRTSNKKSSFWD